eukprot:gene12694-15926_t
MYDDDEELEDMIIPGETNEWEGHGDGQDMYDDDEELGDMIIPGESDRWEEPHGDGQDMYDDDLELGDMFIPGETDEWEEPHGDGQDMHDDDLELGDMVIPGEADEWEGHGGGQDMYDDEEVLEDMIIPGESDEWEEHGGGKHVYDDDEELWDMVNPGESDECKEHGGGQDMYDDDEELGDMIIPALDDDDDIDGDELNTPQSLVSYLRRNMGSAPDLDGNYPGPNVTHQEGAPSQQGPKGGPVGQGPAANNTEPRGESNNSRPGRGDPCTLQDQQQVHSQSMEGSPARSTSSGMDMDISPMVPAQRPSVLYSGFMQPLGGRDRSPSPFPGQGGGEGLRAGRDGIISVEGTPAMKTRLWNTDSGVPDPMAISPAYCQPGRPGPACSMPTTAANGEEQDHVGQKRPAEGGHANSSGVAGSLRHLCISDVAVHPITRDPYLEAEDAAPAGHTFQHTSPATSVGHTIQNPSTAPSVGQKSQHTFPAPAVITSQPPPPAPPVGHTLQHTSPAPSVGHTIQNPSPAPPVGHTLQHPSPAPPGITFQPPSPGPPGPISPTHRAHVFIKPEPQDPPEGGASPNSGTHPSLVEEQGTGPLLSELPSGGHSPASHTKADDEDDFMPSSRAPTAHSSTRGAAPMPAGMTPVEAVKQLGNLGLSKGGEAAAQLPGGLDVKVVKALKAPSRGSEAKTRHKLASFKGLQFADTVQLPHLNITLTCKERAKHITCPIIAIQQASQADPQDSEMCVAEPFAIYKMED